jgi:hypothetical protein
MVAEKRRDTKSPGAEYAIGASEASAMLWRMVITAGVFDCQK